MTTKERSARWKWARSSKQAKKVREIGKSHYKAVEMVKSLSTVEREKNKKKKMAKAMKYLEEVRWHGGSVSESSLVSLDSITEDQLTSEVRYLRATIAPNIREKRKDGNKFVKFDKEQQIFQIKNSIKPTLDEDIDLDGLLSSLFLKPVTVSENEISEAP